MRQKKRLSPTERALQDSPLREVRHAETVSVRTEKLGSFQWHRIQYTVRAALLLDCGHTVTRDLESKIEQPDPQTFLGNQHPCIQCFAENLHRY